MPPEDQETEECTDISSKIVEMHQSVEFRMECQVYAGRATVIEESCSQDRVGLFLCINPTNGFLWNISSLVTRGEHLSGM